MVGIEELTSRASMGHGSSTIYGIALSDSINGEVVVSFAPQTGVTEPELPDDEPDWEWSPIEDSTVSEDDPESEMVFETYDEGGA